MIDMIMELLGHENYIRVLLLVRRRRSLRFSQIQKALDLNPAQVDRALKFLRKGLWLVPHTVPAQKGRVLVEYRLGKRGEAFLDSFESFRAAAQERRAALGPSELRELQRL